MVGKKSILLSGTDDIDLWTLTLCRCYPNPIWPICILGHMWAQYQNVSDDNSPGNNWLLQENLNWPLTFKYKLYWVNSVLLWQKEASDKSPKSELLMLLDWT